MWPWAPALLETLGAKPAHRGNVSSPALTIRQPSPAADIDVMESKEETDDHARVARRYAQSTRGIARLHFVAIR